MMWIYSYTASIRSIGYKVRSKVSLLLKREIPLLSLKTIGRSSRLPVLAICRFEDLRLGPGNESALPNPFFLAAEALSEGSGEKAVDILSLYYHRVRFKSWGEFLGCTKKQEARVQDYSPLAEVWPWTKKTQEIFAVNDYKKAIDREFKNYGAISDGDYSFYFGPVSKKKIRWELDRLLSVIDSIKKRGYTRSNCIDGDIAGWLLLHEGERVVHIHGGIHRIAALWALGYDKVLIRIDGVYDCAQMSDWQAVNDGTYTHSMVTRVFKNMCKTRCTLKYLDNSWLTKDR